MNAILRKQNNIWINSNQIKKHKVIYKPVSSVIKNNNSRTQDVNEKYKSTTDSDILENVVLRDKRTVGYNCMQPSPQYFKNLSFFEIEPYNSFLLSRRYFSLNSKLYNQPSSKVEQAVQTLKDKQKQEESAKRNISHVESIATVTQAQVSSKITEKKTEVVIAKKPLKTRIWEEILHYYHGFRLLFIDINVCRKLFWRIMNGKKLTRRENRLLIRTTSDLFRLVPFSVFIIVPFMELLLPIFIKFFPGMLPSTFQTAKDHEEKLKQSLSVKLEVAKFLQKTLDEMSVQHKEHKSEEAKIFSDFFKKIKDPTQHVTPEEIIKFSKKFEDEITLVSLSRESLQALCRMMELNTLGTSNFLRLQLRMKLRSLAADDQIIAREGVDSLNLYEVQQACKARGMRAYGVSEETMRSQMQEWIDLNLNEKVPSSLLLLSRAMMATEEQPTADKLKDTIRALPDLVAAQTKAAIGEAEGKIDNKTKIEIIQEEVKKIKEERKEESEDRNQINVEKEQVLIDKAPVINTEKTIELPSEMQAKAPLKVTAEGSDLTFKDVELLSEALDKVSKDKQQLLVEKEAIKELKEEIQDYQEDIEELNQITAFKTKAEVKETRGAKRLFKRVNKIIDNLDKVVTNLEKKKEKISLDISKSSEGDAEDKKSDELVEIKDLLNAIKQIKQVPDKSRLEAIESVLSKMDTDQDGQIKVEDVIKVVEVLSEEGVKLNQKQIEEVIELLDKEESLEAEDKIEKAMEKSIKENKQKDADQLQDIAPVIEDRAEEIKDAADLKYILKKKVDERNVSKPDLKTVDSDKETSASVGLSSDKTLPPTTIKKIQNQKDKTL